MSPIASFAFIDLEARSKEIQNVSDQHIVIELSVIVINREHMKKKDGEGEPRVQAKFTHCFNPKVPFLRGQSDLNERLVENCPSFSTEKVFRAIEAFLHLQSKPVCLVAHKGFKHDFRILKELFSLLEMSLSDDVMCADSLFGFYELRPDNWQESQMEEDQCGPRDIAETRKEFPWTYTNRPTESYQLSDVHERLCGCEIQAHHAENDVRMMMHCARTLGDRFVHWADRYHYKFNEIEIAI